MTSDKQAMYLVETVTQLAEARSIEQVADVVKVAARNLAHADGASFVLRDGDQCHYLDEDAISPLWKGRRFDAASCVSGWSMNYRQQLIIADVFADERVVHEFYRPTFVRSLAMTPVRGLNALAAIGVYWKDFHCCTPEEAGLLQALADSTAVTLERIETESELRQLREQRHINVDTPLMMCAWTRRVKYRGRWVSFEAFLLDRFGITISHGISDDAQQALVESLQGGSDPG